MKITGFLGLALVLAFASIAQATPHISDFSLGLSREEILLRQVTEHGDYYCGEVGFGGLTWAGTFSFNSDKLSAISLAAPNDASYLQAALRAFADSSFVIYQVVSDVKGFDLTQLTRQGYTQEEVDRAFAACMSQIAQSGASFCTFFYTKPASIRQLGENGQVNGPPSEQAAGAGAPTDAAVSCSLTIDQHGLTIIMMSWADMRQDLERREALALGAMNGKG